MRDHYTEETLARVRENAASLTSKVTHLIEDVQSLSSKVTSLEETLERIMALSQRIFYVALATALGLINLEPRVTADFARHLLDGFLK